MSERAELIEQELSHFGPTGVRLGSVEAAAEPTAHHGHLEALALLLERSPDHSRTPRTACGPPSSPSTASERSSRTVPDRLTTWP